MSQFGYRPCSRRTVTGYSTLLWRASFWPSFSPTKRYECCCRTSTFRSTARRLLHGHRRRASWRRMDRTNRRPPGATANAILIASSAAMRRTPRARIRNSSVSRKGKGKEAKLGYTGNVMTENRNGFVVEAELRQVSGMVERATEKDMIVRYSPGAKRITVGADKGYDTADHVADQHELTRTPQVAQKSHTRSV